MDTERRKKIKLMLVANTLSSAWLLDQLRKRHIETDKYRLCKVLSGTLKGEHASRVLVACEEILHDYEAKFNV